MCQKLILQIYYASDKDMEEDYELKVSVSLFSLTAYRKSSDRLRSI